MNKLSLYERPMHCTDKKRETLYIKEEDKKYFLDNFNTIEIFKGKINEVAVIQKK